MTPVVLNPARAAKVPKTRIVERLWRLRGDYVAGAGGFLLVLTMALPWYAIGHAGDAPMPGPEGGSLGAATGVVVAYALLIFLGAGIRSSPVVIVFSLALVAFLGFLLSQAVFNPPALFSDPWSCPRRSPSAIIAITHLRFSDRGQDS